MRKLITIFVIFFFFCPLIRKDGGGQSFAQQNVGIGTITPDHSARLEIFSNNQGLLIPRVWLISTTDNTTISSPAISLLVYNKNAAMFGGGLGIYYWDGNQWIQAFGVAGGIGETGATGTAGIIGVTGATGI